MITKEISTFEKRPISGRAMHNCNFSTSESGLNEITSQIIAAAMKVHSAIGPGILESVYETCLQHELQRSGLRVRSQVSLPVLYEGMHLESGYRIDLLVEDKVIVELKCVETVLPIHKAQLLTYLRLANKPFGSWGELKVEGST